MSANPALLSLSEIASEAHAKIQQDFVVIKIPLLTKIRVMIITMWSRAK